METNYRGSNEWQLSSDKVVITFNLSLISSPDNMWQGERYSPAGECQIAPKNKFCFLQEANIATDTIQTTFLDSKEFFQIINLSTNGDLP